MPFNDGLIRIDVVKHVRGIVVNEQKGVRIVSGHGKQWIERKKMKEDLTTFWGRGPSIKPQEAAEYRDGLIHAMRVDTKLTASRVKGMVQDPDRDFVWGMTQKMAKAEVVLWDTNYFQAATNGEEAFIGCKQEWPEELNQFWILNKDIVVMLEDDLVAFGIEEKRVLIGEIWIHVSQGKLYVIQLVHLVSTEEPKDKLNHAVPITLVGAWDTSDLITGKFSPIVAAYKFMNTPLIAEPKRFVYPRGERRRALRENRVLPEVKVVTLRRREYHDRLVAEGLEKRQLHYQFVVSAHWRQQYYPSTEEHKPKWIESYLKGPEEAPLLPVKPTVYKVTR